VQIRAEVRVAFENNTNERGALQSIVETPKMSNFDALDEKISQLESMTLAKRTELTEVRTHAQAWPPPTYTHHSLYQVRSHLKHLESLQESTGKKLERTSAKVDALNFKPKYLLISSDLLD
jgi:hypothetical protein